MNNLKRKLITHALLLTAAVLAASLWTSSELLSGYSLQFIAFLIVGYFIVRLIITKIGSVSVNARSSLDITVLTMIIFILIFSTGALSSPFFFLLYFLLFGLALLFEPGSSLFMVFISAFVFLLIPEKKDLCTELLQLASLFMIVPLALIFGNQYIKLMQSELEVKSLTAEEKSLSEKIDKQQKQVKHWTEEVFGRKLAEIQQYLKTLETAPGTTGENRDLLKKVSGKIYETFVSGREMEKEVKDG